MTYYVERLISPSVGYSVIFSVGMDQKNVRDFLTVVERMCRLGEIKAKIEDVRVRKPALYSIPDRWFDGTHITDTYKGGK